MLCTERLLESMLRHAIPYRGYMSVMLDVLTRVPLWLQIRTIVGDRVAWQLDISSTGSTFAFPFVKRLGLSSVTLTGLSLACHVMLPDHGVWLDGQSCSCLMVGWPVGLSSLTLGVGRPSVMFLFDCWPVVRPMLRTVRGCYRRARKDRHLARLSLSREYDGVLAVVKNKLEQKKKETAEEIRLQEARARIEALTEYNEGGLEAELERLKDLEVLLEVDYGLASLSDPSLSRLDLLEISGDSVNQD
ncbi:hypothetical protein F2Q70_00003156 [Brassica cretica]|uniref:Uncharacterized protein n=1 Tax=Brassica cretica TaxID=69181 RepID=A0A8S9J3M5_BRACR|nr:hypothetical protein F2Q70_00003156 [Brassica cretica]